MKNKSTIAIGLGILGLSLGTQAEQKHAISLEASLIRKEDISKLAEKYQHQDMNKALIKMGLIQDINSKNYFLLDTKKIEAEKALAAESNDELTIDILKTILQNKVVVKNFREVSPTQQDFRPMRVENPGEDQDSEPRD